MSNFFLDIDQSEPLKSLNDRNDLSRMAYQNKSSDIPLNNGIAERLESDSFINHKDSFEMNNSRINALNEEVRGLKVQKGELQEKEDTIMSLKESLQSMTHENSELMMKNRSITSENISLKEDIDNHKRKAESESQERDRSAVAERSVEESDSAHPRDDGKIAIDITRLKSVLCSRLKTYHEKHIDDLISQYDLMEKKEIDKSMMEEILLEAIHF